ncbi:MULTISPECIES: methionyl-tRNA formyltransferase [Enterococcus]|uniref:methionyl-tRNA formyltransferase n=1 Tax=Enterococcus TaxID=1350 RepID=UPI0004D36563|nr:methionyl-tRNA formyltransferase [Enterococcus hirae]OWW47077.1 methionyl-tRNA formyltransferase [Enterococcus hirae 81-15-F4]OWW62431.1 methionyl-tRNA formyltransferase [Enterococcus hirae 88-15-E09]OWW67985.1 methionyl-tRNA formyltransferase [Enterococcus hirae 57-03-H11]EMF0036274.1 methionyl-tRNA formyltransferase [Enterococcus hirae]EMF0046738.1 methionyl-tRNA formyltransferase [Enterococcus hirae]
MTKLVFMGTPAFSVPILEGLLEEGYEVVAVVTQPDRPVGRKKIITPTPVKEAAVKHGLLVLQPEKISGSEEMEKIIALQPDVIITAAFGQFLPEKLLQAPVHGAINVHASLLPKYRGGAPVHYSIINGEKETGVTIMEMIKKMDAGGIYAQESLPITKQDDVGTMFEKLSALGKQLLLKTLPDILNGNLSPRPQDESKVTFSPNITREQEAIDWNKTAEEIDNQVRGMRPWPIAFTTYEQTRWKLLNVEALAEKTTAEPGTIIKKDKKNLWIACGKQTVLAIKELQPAGKGKQAVNEFLNGSGQQVMIGQQVK